MPAGAMIFAAMRTMWLGLLRDRAAIAMVFALPPLMFLVFATIMDGSDGSNLRLKLGVLAETDDPEARRLLDALAQDEGVRLAPERPEDLAELRALVSRDVVDVGLVLRGPLAASAADAEAPLLLIVDPAKANTGPILIGQIRSVLGRALPDVALRRNLAALEPAIGPLTPEQAARAGQAAAALAEGAGSDAQESDAVQESDAAQESHAAQGGGGGGEGEGASDGVSGPDDGEAAGGDGLIDTVLVDEDAPGAVVYYAGAVAIMFLLFTAANGALALIDEREAGVIERLAAYPGAMDALVLGKFSYLTLQGIAQTALIFAVAAALYGVDLAASPIALAVTTVLAATFSAAGGLAIAALSSSKQQAGALANFLILVFSALGGSMVPRYFMEPWLQDLGWFTPNAWVIEAYRAAVGRGAPLDAFAAMWMVLAAATLIALAAAILGARRGVNAAHA